jgi:hypothetical protein
MIALLVMVLLFPGFTGLLLFGLMFPKPLRQPR